MRLLLVLFLGTVTLIRRAQRNYFNKLDNPNALLGLLQHEEHGFANLKDSVEDVRAQNIFLWEEPYYSTLPVIFLFLG
jgi:hypothetical protein